MENVTTKLNPYLHFEDNCEEALNFYKSILNGAIDIRRFESAPMEVPENHKNKILHAVFSFGDNVIMASDSFPGSKIQKGNNMTLSLDLSEAAQSYQLFEALAKDGKVIMPFEKQFWGALFGQLEDQFGIRWMVSCNNPS